MSINYLDKTGLEHIGDIANYKKRNIDYITYTGTDLEIEDTLENKINFNNLYGQTEQDSYEGKNKIQLSTVSFNNITTTLNSDGSITCNGTTNTTYFNIMSYQKQLENFLPIGTYTFSRIGDVTYPVNFILYNSDKTQSKIFTIPSNSTVITGQLEFKAQYCSASYNAPSGTQISFTTKLQFEPGSTATDYEPYVGGKASPNPDYPQEIKTVTGRQVVKITGKNLFNKNSVELGKIVSRTDGTLSDAANYNASDYIPMKENTTYTLTALNFNRWYSACYDENKNYIGYVENEATFTTISGTKYMRFTVYNDLMDTAMIVEGNTVPDTYEEYKEQVYELNLGKNLFDINGDFTYGGYSDVPIINNDGTLTSNANYSVTRSAGELISLLKPNTNYILSAKLISTTSTDSNKAVVEILQGTRGSLTVLGRTYFTQTDGKTISFTTPNDTSKIWISISSIGANTSSTFGNIQLEKGEEATSYSPYFTPIELCEIGDYQDSIKRSTGKNLFSSEIELGDITGTGTKEDSTTRCRTKDFISIKPNTTYSLWNNKSQTYNLYFYDENKTYLSYLYVSGNSFTAPANAKYIMFLFGNVVLDILVMLNEGSTALPYEPYGVGKWYVEKKIGKVVLDGSEEWIDQSVYDTTGYSRYRTNINTNTSYNNGYDNRFTQRVSQEHGSYEYLWLQPNTGTLYIQLLSNRLSEVNLNGFKTWLSNNNVILYYQLSTSTVEEITDEELIEQLNDLYNAFYMNSKTYINVEGDLPIVLEINHDKPRFLNLIDKGELQKYIMDLEKRVAILESQITE